MSNNYVLLDRIELNNTAASVTFDNIPQTGYTDLKVVTSTRLSATDSPILVNFRGVTTGYSWRRIYGNGSSASSLSGTDGYFLHGNTSSTTANTFSNAEFYIPNYTASQSKSISVDTALETNATGGELFMLAALWANNLPITSISMTPLTGSFVANSTFSLYGLAQVGTTPAIAPKADGGNVIGTDGTYWYHAFLSNGTFTPQVGLSCDVLQVAGGGGGGSTVAGGGGAGGVLAFANQSLAISAYSVTIGAGGTGGVSNNAGTNGGNSQFASLTASVGGGGGGGYNSSSGSSGGSGGGGGNDGISAQAGGSATSGQGFAGGSSSGSSVNSQTAAGGGGAGAVGANNSSVSGAGGIGTTSVTNWGALTSALTALSLGSSNYLAGGGGAGSNGPAAGAGGTGGGGAGGNAANGNPAIINTGSGGGGGGGSGTRLGAAGGSGIVIVRYLVA